MKNIKLDERLLGIAHLVPPCTYVADIGTDHGYLPIYLIENKIVKFAFVSDIAKLPLQKAIDNFKSYNLTSYFKPILCDGLKMIPSECECIIIAGMGGNLISDIIIDRPYEYKTMILQPNLHPEVLRETISNIGYRIIDEDIVVCNKKYYEIIKIIKGEEKLNPNQIKFGPINMQKKSSLFIKKWLEIKNKYEDIVKTFKGSNEQLDSIKVQIININNVLSDN